MAKAPPITAYCAACDNQVSGGRTGSGHFQGQDNRIYCEECGEMMQRMERMFIPEGAIIKDPRTGATTPPRPAPERPPKPLSNAALRAVGAAGTRPATAAVGAVSRPPGSGVQAAVTDAIPGATAPPARSGGGGKFLLLLLLAVAGVGGAWAMGYLPQLDPLLQPIFGASAPTQPEPPKNDPTPPPVNTVTPPPTNGGEPPNTGGVVSGGTVAGVIAADDSVAIEATIGKDTIIEGRVVAAEMADSAKSFRIRFGLQPGAFEAVIQSRRFEQFKSAFGRDVAGALLGKLVRVNGKVFRVEDHPQITLDRPSQLEVVGN